jgi:hypothetical protein
MTAIISMAWLSSARHDQFIDIAENKIDDCDIFKEIERAFAARK